MIFEYILVQIHSSDSFFWVGFISHVQYIFLKKLYGLFLWMGFNCLKATEPPQGGTLLFTSKLPLTLSFPKNIMPTIFHIYQACQWMACDCACMHPHTPVFIYLCYHHTYKTLYDDLIACQHFSKCAQLSFCK